MTSSPRPKAKSISVADGNKKQCACSVTFSTLRNSVNLYNKYFRRIVSNDSRSDFQAHNLLCGSTLPPSCLTVSAFPSKQNLRHMELLPDNSSRNTPAICIPMVMERTACLSVMRMATPPHLWPAYNSDTGMKSDATNLTPEMFC